MTGWIEASVPLLRCRTCSGIAAHLVFIGDTDMVTSGLVALASATRDEIVVAELADTSGAAVRINTLLGRDDLRDVPLLRDESPSPPAGLSFQHFRAAYRPPHLIYGCPKCETGEAEVIREIAPSDFIRTGGTLTVLPDLEIRD